MSNIKVIEISNIIAGIDNKIKGSKKLIFHINKASDLDYKKVISFMYKNAVFKKQLKN
jgi:hypothetical protein|tara:strand:+ start:4963 stop:5136 length:174 start_codon:yes stop_codon:yes gene_type:complete